MRDCPLTGAQLVVVQGIADGLTYKQIAVRLGRSESTIRSHLHNAIQRLEVYSSAQVAIKCMRAGWVDSPNDEEGTDVTAKRAERVEMVISRLAAATERLVEILLARKGLTRAQARYLAAFDDLLFARTSEQTAEARGKIDRALRSVLTDARVQIRDRQRGDLVELLVCFGTKGLEV